MADAYLCDKCGKFFPGLSNKRWLPLAGKRDEYKSPEGNKMELCRFCMKEFDDEITALNSRYQAEIDKYKGKIRVDLGHNENE